MPGSPQWSWRSPILRSKAWSSEKCPCAEAFSLWSEGQPHRPVQLGLIAQRIFQGVGENGQAVEVLLLVGGLGDVRYRVREPDGFDHAGPKGVTGYLAQQVGEAVDAVHGLDVENGDVGGTGGVVVGDRVGVEGVLVGVE